MTRKAKGLSARSEAPERQVGGRACASEDAVGESHESRGPARLQRSRGEAARGRGLSPALRSGVGRPDAGSPPCLCAGVPGSSTQRTCKGARSQEATLTELATLRDAVAEPRGQRSACCSVSVRREPPSCGTSGLAPSRGAWPASRPTSTSIGAYRDARGVGGGGRGASEARVQGPGPGQPPARSPAGVRGGVQLWGPSTATRQGPF